MQGSRLELLEGRVALERRTERLSALGTKHVTLEAASKGACTISKGDVVSLAPDTYASDHVQSCALE